MVSRPITSAPSTVPRIRPTPPKKLMPPSTAAAMELRVYGAPIVGSAEPVWTASPIPASPVNAPASAYPEIFTARVWRPLA